MKEDPSFQDLVNLWEVCERFVKDMEISCVETIYQCDWVIENAYEFVEDICKLVGYVEEED